MKRALQSYNATIQVALKSKPYTSGRRDFDRVVTALEPFHAAVHPGERDWMAATITLPAESLNQAAAAALAIVTKAYRAEGAAVVAMPASEFDRRGGLARVLLRLNDSKL